MVYFFIQVQTYKIITFANTNPFLTVMKSDSKRDINPSNRLDSLKPSTKKTVYNVSFFCMIASFGGLIATIRYSYLLDTDIAAEIFIVLFFISAIIFGFFRRYKSQWTDNKDSKSDKE